MSAEIGFGVPLGGLEISVDEHMVGCKKAVQIGNRLYLSPAMYDLIRHAEGKELERLLAQIPVVNLGKNLFDPCHDPLPLTMSLSWEEGEKR